MTSPFNVTALRAFIALIGFSLRRHARVRQLAWASCVLLAVLTAMVAVITLGPVHWRVELRSRWVADPKSKDQPVKMTYTQYGEDRLPYYLALPGSSDSYNMRLMVFSTYWATINDPVQKQFRDDWAFVNFSRWVVLACYLSFVLPIFMLAIGSSSFGTDRESQTLIWLLQRPLPRWGLYLAKYLASWPWLLAASLLAYVCVCLAGGELGRKAFTVYWQAALASTIAFGSLFHLLGAISRWPAIIGIAYLFFFETLVANLPSSLKQFSINYYVRSLFYDATQKMVPTVQPDKVDVYAPTDATTAWLVLLGASAVLTMVGMYLTGRYEPKPEA